MVSKEYIGISHVSGPIIIVEGVSGVGFDEMVEITDPGGNIRVGRVLEVTEDLAVVQVFGGTRGLSISSTRTGMSKPASSIVFAAIATRSSYVIVCSIGLPSASWLYLIGRSSYGCASRV